LATTAGEPAETECCEHPETASIALFPRCLAVEVDEIAVNGLVPPSPSDLFTFSRSPCRPSGAASAGSTPIPLPEGLHGAPLGAFCLCLHESITRVRTTQSRTRSAHGAPCQVTPKPGHTTCDCSLTMCRRERRRTLKTERLRAGGRPTEAEPHGADPACRSLEPEAIAHPRPRRRRSPPLPRLVLSPTSGARSRIDVAGIANHTAKTSGHSLSPSRWCACAETHANRNRSRAGVYRRDLSPASCRRLLLDSTPMMARKPTIQASSNGL